jgi:hypothetical protein
MASSTSPAPLIRWRAPVVEANGHPAGAAPAPAAANSPAAVPEPTCLLHTERRADLCFHLGGFCLLFGKQSTQNHCLYRGAGQRYRTLA